VLRQIVIVGLCIFLAMAVVKDGRLLRDVGIRAECVTVQRYADGSTLRACRAGKLEHPPDLGPRGCYEAGDTRRYEYWRCPS
jgi:hypothetical protein